jgi:hypothetical protein
MAAPRQLKLADGPCRWCGGPVVGNHRDRAFCSEECWRLRRGWLTFLVVMSRGADDVFLGLQYAKLDLRDRDRQGGGLVAA